jgi:pimeloyl-ACP methyl ester carboxylesterase
MDWITTLFFLVRGFRFYRQPRSSFFSLFPLRPITLLSPHASASPALSYFYRPHRSKTQRPILFLHGVGVGLIPYVPWLNSIPSDVGVLAVEILPISSRICPPLPATTELVEGIRAILEQQQMDDFVLVGHSFGTLLVSPMLRDDRVSARIDSVVLIDPVSLLLHLPQVAYNFTRRKPKYGNEWEIHFAATDPGIAHTLARRFWWHDYILWADQLRGRRTTVILGAEDCVTNPDAVASYVYFGDLNFTRNDALEWRTTIERWSGQGELELLYLEGRDHGQVFLSAGGLPQISNVVMGYTQRSKELGGRSSANLPARESV